MMSDNQSLSVIYGSNTSVLLHIIQQNLVHEGEPVRPIDPAAWVSHTAAMTGSVLPHYGTTPISHCSSHPSLVCP